MKNKLYVYSCLFLIFCSCKAVKFNDLSGTYLYNSYDTFKFLVLNEDSTYIQYFPATHMQEPCAIIEGKWTVRNDKLVLNTNIQEQFEFIKVPAMNQDSIRISTLVDIDDYCPFCSVEILNNKKETLYSGLTSLDDGSVTFSNKRIIKNKIIFTGVAFESYYDYVEKGYDYTLWKVKACSFDVLKNKKCKIENNSIIINKGFKQKEVYVKIKDNKKGRIQLKVMKLKKTFDRSKVEIIDFNSVYYNFREFKDIDVKLNLIIRFFENGQYAYFIDNQKPIVDFSHDNFDYNDLEEATFVGYYNIIDSTILVEYPNPEFTDRRYREIDEYKVLPNGDIINSSKPSYNYTNKYKQIPIPEAKRMKIVPDW